MKYVFNLLILLFYMSCASNTATILDKEEYEFIEEELLRKYSNINKIEYLNLKETWYPYKDFSMTTYRIVLNSGYCEYNVLRKMKKIYARDVICE